jgi:hypothetical protein
MTIRPTNHESLVLYGPFRRLKNDSTQTPEVAVEQLRSGQLWGKPIARDPVIKAHAGKLEDDEEGLEFWAPVPPDNPHGMRVYWRYAGPYVEISNEIAKLTVFITRVTQPVAVVA